MNKQKEQKDEKEKTGVEKAGGLAQGSTFGPVINSMTPLPLPFSISSYLSYVSLMAETPN